MSMIVATQKTATLSAATRKAFNAVPINAIVHGAIFRDGIANETSIKPSDIRMTTSAAHTALGGKMSPQSFVLGLIFAVVRYAHGNKIEINKLPLGSQVAVDEACSLIKMGAGISALSLETATLAGVQALLALPAPAKKVPATAPALAAPALAAPALNLPALRAGIAARQPITDCDEDGYSNVHLGTAQTLADKRAQDAAKDAANSAILREIAAEQFDKDAANSAANLVTTVTARRDAEEIARSIAASLGFKLVRIPAKKSA